jgi:hypothetical protein
MCYTCDYLFECLTAYCCCICPPDKDAGNDKIIPKKQNVTIYYQETCTKQKESIII